MKGRPQMATKKTTAKIQSSAQPLERQPQSKQKAAQSVGLTLHTDDSWSNAYWTDGDLHCEERKLFG